VNAACGSLLRHFLSWNLLLFFIPLSLYLEHHRIRRYYGGPSGSPHSGYAGSPGGAALSGHWLIRGYTQMVDIYQGEFSEETREEVQRKVRSLLRIGIFFSIFWLAGIGSIISIVLGLKARNIIKRANMNISGMGGVYWCIIVGGLGLIILLLIFIAVTLPIFLKKY
jgi:hypothetical protein